jgi:Zn-dependent alcohol dehydrogenase
MTVTKTRGAVLMEPNGRWEIKELSLDPPKANEVLVHVMATGLCHSDEHVGGGVYLVDAGVMA